MRHEQEFERNAIAAQPALRRTSAMAGRAIAMLRPKQARAAITPLPLTKLERGHYSAADFAYDAAGVESFRGLSRAESLDYMMLQRVGLDNDDAAFLRLIGLGDRHASAMRMADLR